MLDANNISIRSDVRHIRFQCLQTGSKITSTPSRHQIHSKTEMLYLQSKNTQKNIFSLKSTENKNIQPQREKYSSKKSGQAC